MRPLALALALLGLVGTGCQSPCLQLASKICDCQNTQQDRDNCNSQASARNDTIKPTQADENTCSALVDKCDCHALNTPEGKRNCGLAR